MARLLRFEIITPEGIRFHEEVYEVLLPTPDGQIGVFPNHVPLISLIVPGVISVRKAKDTLDKDIDHFATSGGLVEIDGAHVRMLADTAEHADTIDALRAQEALHRALEIKHAAEDHVSLADATGLIERNLARLKVADLNKRHHS
jgi:F-type H+-transporting ATPase subunit epsilon